MRENAATQQEIDQALLINAHRIQAQRLQAIDRRRMRDAALNLFHEDRFQQDLALYYLIEQLTLRIDPNE